MNHNGETLDLLARTSRLRTDMQEIMVDGRARRESQEVVMTRLLAYWRDLDEVDQMLFTCGGDVELAQQELEQEFVDEPD
jgi:hypothetical protein